MVTVALLRTAHSSPLLYAGWFGSVLSRVEHSHCAFAKALPLLDRKKTLFLCILNQRSTGCVIFELINLKKAFEGNNLYQLMNSITEKDLKIAEDSSFLEFPFLVPLVES